MTDIVRAHLRVSGRVQGVWFRATTAEQGQRLGLCGWVRNLNDGSVEVIAEGSPAAVEALIGFCRVGPPLARVDDVELAWEAARGESDFEIRRQG